MMATKDYRVADQPCTMRLPAAVLPILAKIHIMEYRWTGGVVVSSTG